MVHLSSSGEFRPVLPSASSSHHHPLHPHPAWRPQIRPIYSDPPKKQPAAAEVFSQWALLHKHGRSHGNRDQGRHVPSARNECHPEDPSRHATGGEAAAPKTLSQPTPSPTQNEQGPYSHLG